MENTGYGNAMTEIALALAMAFFSIMVVTMISMGVGRGAGAPAAGAVLAPPAADSAPAAAIAPADDDLVIVYWAGRYRDRELKPVDPETIRARGRVVLALDPRLPMGEALAARARIDVENLVVSVLDESWMETLRRMTDERP